MALDPEMWGHRNFGMALVADCGAATSVAPVAGSGRMFAMSDILADYREWREGLPERISTHSDRCHMWHERCMIHRLAQAVEKERHVSSQKNWTLTDAEREAMEAAACICEDAGRTDIAIVINVAMARLGGAT